MPKTILNLLCAVLAGCFSSIAYGADNSVSLSLKDHVFTPAEIHVNTTRPTDLADIKPAAPAPQTRPVLVAATTPVAGV